MRQGRTVWHACFHGTSASFSDSVPSSALPFQPLRFPFLPASVFLLPLLALLVCHSVCFCIVSLPPDVGVLFVFVVAVLVVLVAVDLNCCCC
jgi:hypothetical protein